MRRSKRAWIVPGVVQRVVDGDTLVADLDLGWGVRYTGASIRMADVDCPEMDTAEGQAAAKRMQELLPVGAEIMVCSHSRDKFGRVLATVLVGSRSVAELLVAEGHARAYGGGSRARRPGPAK